MINSARAEKGRWSRHAAVTAAMMGVLALAGCASNGGTPYSGSGPGGASGTTVTISSAAGDEGVLATEDGRTLYVTEQEDGTVLCTSDDCTAVWIPLVVDQGETPTGPDSLKGTLGTITRPDGAVQVTLDDKPLYTFSFDRSAGEVGGEGVEDSFDGTDFTWHVATATGKTSTIEPSPEDGYNY